MPARGNRVSKHSYASSLDPGPPCSSRTLRSGLLPTRLVQTWKSPLGVLTGILREPPDSTSRGSQVEVSKYDAGGLVIPDKLTHYVALDSALLMSNSLPSGILHRDSVVVESILAQRANVPRSEADET